MTGATIADLIRRQAAERPAAPALVLPSRPLTYGELHERSSRAANALAAMGVGPGDRVAFLDKNSPEYFDVVFGAAKLNAVPLALNWRLSPGELAHVLSDAEPAVVVAGAEFSDLEAEQLVIFGDGTRSYEDWLSAQPADDPEVGAEPDDLALLVYTSGTTGLPRGAMITHANLGFLLPKVSDAWGFTAESVNLVAMPLFHVSGGGWALVGMHEGGRAVLLRDVDLDVLLSTIEDERISHAALVVSVVQFLLAHPRCATTDFSSLELLAYGGSPPPPAVMTLASKTFGCDFTQLYGMTEATGAVAALPPDDHDPAGPFAHRLASCGRPYPWVEVRIADPATGAEVPTGEPGEITLRSAQIMKGYWRREAETADALTGDGWLRTGDGGHIDADGYLYLSDRVKDMIISGAENVYPAEVERVLADHPAVADGAVFGVPDDRWGESPMAAVILRPGIDPGPELAAELVDWCRARLAHYKCPASVAFVTDLPRNASGKVLKRLLREPYWAGRTRRI